MTCPSCGYCPHCGRSARPALPYEWVPPTIPLPTYPYPWYPTTTWIGTQSDFANFITNGSFLGASTSFTA